MVWDKAVPAASTGLKASNPQMLANQDALETGLDREHNFATSGTQDALHKQGSARCFFQDAAPSTRVDGDAFTSDDLGSLWIDSNSSPDNQFNFLSAIGPIVWTPISTEAIAVMVAAAHTWAEVQTHAKQIISTLAIGTKPLAVTSTTKCDNLNADQVDGYDADAYSGGESFTAVGGFIIKQGTANSTTDGIETFTFGAAFPNACISVQLTRDGEDSLAPLHVESKSTANFKIDRDNDINGSQPFYWVAFGY